MTVKKKCFKLVTVLAFICAIVFSIGFCACNNSSGNGMNDNIQSFKIAEVYEQFQSQPLSVEVRMNDGHEGTFTIDDSEQIKQIYSLVVNQEYNLMEGMLPPGSNKYLKFVFDDNSEFSCSSRYVYYLNECYLGSNSLELDVLLVSIGLEKEAISER
ncbi:MAG: hypothetical protein K2N14_03830 [Clostridia bacterium]|nr:hypothetical protein [Clostridia bacterium]